MSDVVVEAAMLAGTSRGMRSVVFVNSEVGYVFGINGDSDLDYMKTTDGGATWGAAVDVFTGTVLGFDVWYDQWTPGDTGRNIHIWYFDSGTDDVDYKRFNTTNDTLSAAVNILTGSTAVAARGVFVSGTKARGGKLFVAFDMDAAAEKGLYRSIDNGATWGARTDPIEETIDQCLLFPANAADPNDIWMLYQDASTDELTIKTHDDSADTNAESAALVMAENVTDATGQYGFSGSIRHSDGNLIFAFFNAYDAAGEDFLVYRWDGASATALTALTTDIDDMYHPSVFIDNETNHIYIAYVGLSDGSETLATGTKIYYALSKDNGITWTKDIAYMEATATDTRQTWAPLNGDRFLVVWMDISALSLNSNHVNSKDFGTRGLNNFFNAKAKGAGNTGIISTSGGIY